MTKLPKLYNIYKCYDDGKITTSRQYDVLILCKFVLKIHPVRGNFIFMTIKEKLQS